MCMSYKSEENKRVVSPSLYIHTLWFYIKLRSLKYERYSEANLQFGLKFRLNLSAMKLPYSPESDNQGCQTRIDKTYCYNKTLSWRATGNARNSIYPHTSHLEHLPRPSPHLFTSPSHTKAPFHRTTNDVMGSEYRIHQLLRRQQSGVGGRMCFFSPLPLLPQGMLYDPGEWSNCGLLILCAGASLKRSLQAGTAVCSVFIYIPLSWPPAPIS